MHFYTVSTLWFYSGCVKLMCWAGLDQENQTSTTSDTDNSCATPQITNICASWCAFKYLIVIRNIMKKNSLFRIHNTNRQQVKLVTAVRQEQITRLFVHIPLMKYKRFGWKTLSHLFFLNDNLLTWILKVILSIM